MEKQLTKGTAEEKVSGKRFTLAGISSASDQVKKVLLQQRQHQNGAGEFPESEIVQHETDIINDKDIDLVIMLETEKNNLQMVSSVLNSGKNLRFV